MIRDSLYCSCKNSYKGNTNAAHPDPFCPYYFGRPHKPERATPPQQEGTHYEGCWQEPGHHNCAVVEVRALRERLAELEAALGDIADQATDEDGYWWFRDRARRALESDHGEQSE